MAEYEEVDYEMQSMKFMESSRSKKQEDLDVSEEDPSLKKSVKLEDSNPQSDETSSSSEDEVDLRVKKPNIIQKSLNLND